MAKKKKKKGIFDSIQKRTAPPTVKMKNKKRAKKADTVGRKEKYKGKDDTTNGNI